MPPRKPPPASTPPRPPAPLPCYKPATGIAGTADPFTTDNVGVSTSEAASIFSRSAAPPVASAVGVHAAVGLLRRAGAVILAFFLSALLRFGCEFALYE